MVRSIHAPIVDIEILPISPVVHPSLVVQGASGIHDFSNFLIVRVTTAAGVSGIGEVNGTLYAVGEDGTTAAHVIRNVLAPKLIGEPIAPVENLEAIVEGALAGSLFTKAGVATALWDAYSRTLDVSMAQALGGVRRREIPIKFSLSGDTDRIKHVYQSATNLGFRAFKLKIGKDPIEDGKRLAFTRALVGENTFLGTDANMGYRRSEARLAVSLMREQRPAFFEQPLAAGDLRGMRELRELGLPIVADESVFRVADLVALLRAEAADIVSIYVGKSAGPSKAVQMGLIADAFGIDSIIGSNGESGVGAAAQLQVAAALPGLSASVPSDIIGEFYYAESVLESRLDSDGGVVRLADAPGLGVTLQPQYLERFTSLR